MQEKVWPIIDYKAQCLLFSKLYQENLELMDSEAVENHRKEVEKEIKKLQRELEWNSILPDLRDDINYAIQTDIDKIKKFITPTEKELLELKEKSEKYATLKKEIRRISRKN